ncbi:MAG: hypothetical protein ACP5US_03895 [Candidatus Kryptoniota bacterium]
MNNKNLLKIPLLIFFLGIVYFDSEGFDAMNAIVKSFLVSFGVAISLLILAFTFTFVLTLQRNREQAERIANEHHKKVEAQL